MGLRLSLKIHQQHMTSVTRKPALLHMRKQRLRSAGWYCAADQHLCFQDSKILLLPISKISNLYPSPVAVQLGLCQTWSETSKTHKSGFSHLYQMDKSISNSRNNGFYSTLYRKFCKLILIVMTLIRCHIMQLLIWVCI